MAGWHSGNNPISGVLLEDETPGSFMHVQMLHLQMENAAKQRMGELLLVWSSGYGDQDIFQLFLTRHGRMDFVLIETELRLWTWGIKEEKLILFSEALAMSSGIKVSRATPGRNIQQEPIMLLLAASVLKLQVTPKHKYAGLSAELWPVSLILRGVKCINFAAGYWQEKVRVKSKNPLHKRGVLVVFPPSS